LMQTYIGAVLRAVGEADATLHEIAFEVIRQTLQQGIVHPLRCIPSVVLSMASPIPRIRQRAVDLFAALDGRHASLIYSRMLDCIQATAAFRKRVAHAVDAPRRCMRTPEAVMASFYGFARQKKPRRVDFVRSLLKPYASITPAGVHPDTVLLCRFIAENLATFDYTSADEVLTVTTELDRVVADYGVPLLSLSDEEDANG
ncbi:sister chromatid cohesion C-terminal domain-containing protein, partial [Thamnocephalis sphaerospora]